MSLAVSQKCDQGNKSLWHYKTAHSTVKPVLTTTFLKRPPVLSDHVVVLP